MLRAKVLPEVLGQIVGDGITSSMLLTQDGALMGSVGDNVDHKVVGAIAAHTWGEYAHAGKDFTRDNELQALLVELEHGRIALAPAGQNFLVCAYASEEAPVGMLKAKVQALGGFLATSLDQIQV